MEKFILTDGQKATFAAFSWVMKVCAANHEILDTIIRNPYSTVGQIREKTNVCSETISKFLTKCEQLGILETFVRNNPDGKGTICQILFNPKPEIKILLSYLMELELEDRNDKRQRKR